MSHGLLYGFKTWWTGSSYTKRISAPGASGGVSDGSPRTGEPAGETTDVLELTSAETATQIEELLRKKQEAAQPTSTTACEDPDPETEDITTPNTRSYIDDLQNFID